MPRGNSNWSPQGMSAKFRAKVLLNWCLMNCCETGQSVLLHKYVHDCFAISVLKPSQITVVSCHIYRKSLRSTTLCSMHTRQTNHCKQSVLQSLRLKYTAPKNYVFQSLSQIHPNHITSSAVNLADTFESTAENSSWPGRHQGIGTAPPTQTSCIFVREITENFPEIC